MPQVRVLALVACVATAGCGTQQPAPDPAPGPPMVAGFSLLPIPSDRERECEKFAALAAGLSCPTVFPRPARSVRGHWSVKPVRERAGHDEPVRGIDISYLPDDFKDLPKDQWIIHFTLGVAAPGEELVGYGAELPARSGPAILGGRRGTYAPPSGPAPCCNHAIFVWREGDWRYAASLHTVGPATEKLLDAMVDRH